MKKKCDPMFFTFSAAQCTRCMMLADEHERTCGVCEGDLRTVRPSPASLESRQSPASSSTSKTALTPIEVGRTIEADSWDSHLQAETTEAAATMKVRL